MKTTPTKRDKGGLAIPVNYQEGLQDGDIFDHNQHISHFMTCPSAREWRKTKV
jgi:hypothetical protein